MNNKMIDETPEVDVPPADKPISPDAPEMERECLSRAEAVRILMDCQRGAAKEGYPEIVEALSMAIANIVRRHRQCCRNKAKRRAAAKEVA